jgi:ADP-L-glycero-D-manno-heptose 6-epimerase
MALFKSYRAEYADGEQRRDFIYVKDAVRATLFLATQHHANGIFNIGSGRAATWNELMAHVFAALHKPLRITYIDMPEYLKSAYQYSTIAGLERLRDAGYDVPMTELGAAIREYVGYLQAGQKLDPQMLSAV